MHGCNFTSGELNASHFGDPMPWIGVYVALGSLICAVAMALDTYSGFRQRKPWFPCRRFTLNAASLTLIAVATKMPVDLNSSMPRREDQLIKVCGTALMCTFMSNFMPSLADMRDGEIFSNIVALGILVITIIVNIGIQMSTGVIFVFIPEHVLILILMWILLIILVLSALSVPTTKDELEEKYNERHRKIKLNVDGRHVRAAEVKKVVEKYWMMAHTGSPQFVVGRSVTCTASGAICLLSALILIESVLAAYVTRVSSLRFCNGRSDYEWSSPLILICQCTTVLIGTIAPASRWFNAINFRKSDNGWNFAEEFYMEKYWTQRLEDWKQGVLLFNINARCGRKFVYKLRNLFLELVIKVHYLVILVSKFVRLISVFPVKLSKNLTSLFRKLCQRRSPKEFQASNQDSTENSDDPEIQGNRELKKYVLQLEGEEKLVDLIMKMGYKDIDKWMKKSKNRAPVILIDLLKKSSTNLEGIKELEKNNNHHSTNCENSLPNCWALPVVTLTSIAISLLYCREEYKKSNALINSVNQALNYIRLIHNHLDDQGLKNLSNAADFVWVRLDLHNKWVEMDLNSLVKMHKRNPEQIMQKLLTESQKMVNDFRKKHNTLGSENHMKWPMEILAANSMYRICNILLKDLHENDDNIHGMFEKIERIISDILCACFTNLSKAAWMECVCCPIEKRVESARKAATLLAELEAFEIEDLSNITHPNPEDMHRIDKWQQLPIGFV